MFNNVTISRQHRRWSSLNAVILTTTTITNTVLMLMILLFVLSASAMAASTLAQSEINGLNIRVTTKQTNNDTATDVKEVKSEPRQYPANGFMKPAASPIQTSRPGCPLCDSSVYSYCSHKLIHDTCCCDFAGTAIYQKPPQCVYYNCSLLYAKSCYEHSLIKNCCCYNPY